MGFEELKTGCVIRYPYLWEREYRNGETEGRKPRPSVVGIRLESIKRSHIFLFPITSKEPESGKLAVEIPDSEKKAAGLDRRLRLWLIFDECNTDTIGDSFYLNPSPPIGQLSKAFLEPYIRIFIKQRKSLKAVNRRAES